MSTIPVMRSASAGRSARLLLIELNEFNPQYLERMAKQLNLLNVAKIFSMFKAETNTADLVEHQGLDPWVQWVGVHCGKPTTEHGIRRLGATRTQTSHQIWHLLAQHGYTWGVWGGHECPPRESVGVQVLHARSVVFR
jgi:hypothetical protein